MIALSEENIDEGCKPDQVINYGLSVEIETQSQILSQIAFTGEETLGTEVDNQNGEWLAKVMADLGRGNEKPEDDHRKHEPAGLGTWENHPRMGHHLHGNNMIFHRLGRRAFSCPHASLRVH